MAESRPLSPLERADLVAYLDGELTGAAARRVERRLSLDARVRAEASALKQAWELLDVLPRAEPSPLFTSRTLDRLTLAQSAQGAEMSATGKAWKPWVLGLGWAAALMLATWAGFSASHGVPSRGAADPELVQTDLVRDLRLIENKRLYDLIDDLEFLSELDHPDLFAEETRGS